MFFFTFIMCVYMHVQAHAIIHMYVEVREQLEGVPFIIWVLKIKFRSSNLATTALIS